jgi:hypothetical protein
VSFNIFHSNELNFHKIKSGFSSFHCHLYFIALGSTPQV